jgi:hypothetical protein
MTVKKFHTDGPDTTSRRHTFAVPAGYEAVRDSDGRATGEIRPTALATLLAPGAGISTLATALGDGRPRRKTDLGAQALAAVVVILTAIVTMLILLSIKA